MVPRAFPALLAERVAAAVRAGDLAVHLQPQVDHATGRPRGAEALLRWAGDGPAVTPPLIVAAAEHAGLGPRLLDLVLGRALEAWAGWGDDGLAVAVNVSAADVHASGFVHRVLDHLDAAGVPARALVLELTESTPLRAADRAAAAFAALRVAGVRVALDDFGTGWSSPERLDALGVDVLKLDRAFVGDHEVARHAAGLARERGLQLVAEGVEDLALVPALGGLGYHVLQGYAIARPMPAPECAAWLAARATRALVA
ncbi:MAG: EAL domain-containing protein [Solirubrobacterales bacterium]|nr:EAL domain-containing protein [Solirubrobacterales bacterium]